MHALPSLPRVPARLAIVAVLVAFILLALASADLGALQLSLGGGAPAEAPTTTVPQLSPTWLHEPLAPPIEQLRR